MNILYLHGLKGWKPTNEKVTFLREELGHNVVAPQVVYQEPGAFKMVQQLVADNSFDWIIGSSMGGYFAYSLATFNPIPILLFNPALHNRAQLEMVDDSYHVPQGTLAPSGRAYLGSLDISIPHQKSKQLLAPTNVQVTVVNGMEHQTPPAQFKKSVHETL